MLTHNNGRFYRGNASFSLPNNCKVLTDGTYGQYSKTYAKPSKAQAIRR